MKTVKTFFLSITFMVSVQTINAATIEVDGIYYNLFAGEISTAKVTFNPAQYTGDIVIPNSVIYEDTIYNVIGIEEAFFNCSTLTSITIPASVTYIPAGSFTGCSSLVSINVASENVDYTSEDGVLFNKNKTNLICCPANKTGIYVIPTSVTNIYSSAFAYCSGLTSIDIPRSVTKIEGSAFAYCSGLTSIIIPRGITNIDDYAFIGCSNLVTIDVENGNAYYTSENGVLFNKNKTNLICCPANKIGDYIIPESVTEINRAAFSGCSSLTSIVVPNSVINIELGSFRDCTGLVSITVPFIGESRSATGVSALFGHSMFNNSPSADKTTIWQFFAPSTLTVVAMPTSLRNVTITGGTTINYGAFYNFSLLTSITLSDSITSISEAAFNNCSSLVSITIPENVTSIGDNAFRNCSALTSIINQSLVPQVINSNIFDNTTYATATLYVPAVSFALYQEAEGWKKFNIVELPNISEDYINITSSDSSAVITWKTYENAKGYRITIYGNETHRDTICTLEFDNEGRLIRLVLYRAKDVMQTASDIYTYTVENLLSDTDYYYTLEILCMDNIVLASQSDSFKTTGDNTSVVETLCATSLRVVGYYSVLGQKLPQEPQSGMYIIMYSNGKTEKVLK